MFNLKSNNLTIITLTIFLCNLTIVAQQSWQTRLTIGKNEFIHTCKSEKYKFTPKLQQSFLEYQKLRAKYQLAKKHLTIPLEFLAKLEKSPLVEATIYGTHLKPADILVNLYSLQIDLGEKRFNKYIQLMLAQAMVDAKQGKVSSIRPRPLLKLKIGGDPRIPINTKATNRKLDVNDHIINFLNEHTLREKVIVGYTPPPLRYNNRGIAIPPSKKDKKKNPIIKEQTRSLYAADVIASQQRQREFNTYMRKKGCNIKIDCGEKIIHWDSREMVRGEQYKKIKYAFELFHNAYKAKGLMPKERDPTPTASEKCLYIIRNYEYRFPNHLQKDRKWPRYPLTAPWQTLVMLVENDQPLREREERWEAFRDKGTFKTYGEYIGSVAQQYDMQSARRIKPFPFAYHTIQMMLKDGGVCGTMGNISARGHVTLGMPSCTAGQPGHCALVIFKYNQKTKTYSCKGAQYATGGDDKTTPHVGWYFGEFKSSEKKRHGKTKIRFDRKPMVYQQSIAWAINYNLLAFTKSQMAETIARILNYEKISPNCITYLLCSALSQNPYNISLIDAIQNLATTPQLQIKYENIIQKIIMKHKHRPECPTNGLYNDTIKKIMFAKLNKLPLPQNKEAIAQIYQYIQKNRCPNQDTLTRYYIALYGLPKLLTITQQKFRNHLLTMRKITGSDADLASLNMTDTIIAASKVIKERKKRIAWGKALFKLTKGREKYFGKRYKLKTNPAIERLAKISQQKMPSEENQITPILHQLINELKISIRSNRTPQSCKQLSDKITNTANEMTNKRQKKLWLQTLHKIINGHEKYQYQQQNKRAKTVVDITEKTIKKLLI